MGGRTATSLGRSPRAFRACWTIRKTSLLLALLSTLVPTLLVVGLCRGLGVDGLGLVDLLSIGLGERHAVESGVACIPRPEVKKAEVVSVSHHQASGLTTQVMFTKLKGRLHINHACTPRVSSPGLSAANVGLEAR
eukprot:683011-Pyramimonas_sp.AAC.1